MRVLELFSGTQSVGRVARSIGWMTISVDIDPTHNPTLIKDILEFDERVWPTDYFQFIWASPPCESYSRARTNAKLDRDEAMLHADNLVTKTLQIISHFSKAHWCIENPATSLLWGREVARGLMEHSSITSYCSFGAPYRKNTRIASSFTLALPHCAGIGKCPSMVGAMHKEWAQKGGGGANGKYHSVDELHSIPPNLVQSIFEQLLFKTCAEREREARGERARARAL